MWFANRTRWALVLLLSLASLHAAGMQMLKGHVPEAVADSKAVGQVARDTRISLAISLPLRNPQELETLLKQLVDPSSPNFRQYLSAWQFAERSIRAI